MRENFLRILESQNSINGRYSDLRRIGPKGGDGAFSILLSATDTQSGKKVALKFYDPTRSGDAYRMACFERESRVLKRLKGHHHILQLVDEVRGYQYQIIDQQTQLPFVIPFQFLALDLAESSVFDYIYEKNSDSPIRHLDVFRSICKGVRRLHSEGICHRDLKPDNCLFMRHRYPVVSDFGTARVLDGSIPSPQVNYQAPVGDLRYAAPELLFGLDGGTVFQCEADMYSLGAILFEIFTKAPLSSYLDPIIKKLFYQFSAIPVQNKKQVFDGIIATISANNKLPDILSCAPPGTIPNCISGRLDRLYKYLSNLDYRSRMTSWDSIFNQLNIMTIICKLERDRQHSRAHRRLIRERRRQARMGY